MTINPHPPLTSFPLAIVVLLVVYELWAMLRPAQKVSNELRLFLICAVSIAVFSAYYSGFWGLEYAAHPEMLRPLTERDASEHQALARVALILVFPFVLFGYLASTRPLPILRSIYLLSLIGLAISLVWTGYHGGKLVFERAAGVSKFAE